MNEVINEFLQQFASKPKGTSKETLTHRAKHWVAVLQSPREFYPNANEFELEKRRSNARRNLRRLLTHHPELLPVVETEVRR